MNIKQLSLAGLIAGVGPAMADEAPDTLVVACPVLANAKTVPLEDGVVVLELSKAQQVLLFTALGEVIDHIVVHTSVIDGVNSGNPN